MNDNMHMKEKNINTSTKDKLQLKYHLIKPFVYFRPSISSVTIRVSILLLLQILMLILTRSYSSVYIVIASVLGAVIAAVINYFLFHEPLYNVINIITQGMLIGLLTPSTYPVVIIFFISLLSIFISRCIVFKSANSWMNIPAIAIIIAWFIGRKYFPSFAITSDIIPLKNSSVFLIQNGVFNIYEFDTSITSFLNSHVFNLFDITIPEGIVSLFWDTGVSIPAFRFNLLTIISSIILFSDNAFSPVIPSIFLIVYAVLVRLLAPFLFGGSFNQGDIILAFLTSGTLFCAIFLIQWYGTIPITTVGKIILGLSSGFFAFVVMGCGTSPIGMVFTVLLTNIVNLIIRAFEETNNNISTANVISKLLSKEDEK